jgi:hypothetical protein
MEREPCKYEYRMNMILLCCLTIWPGRKKNFVLSSVTNQVYLNSYVSHAPGSNTGDERQDGIRIFTRLFSVKKNKKIICKVLNA